MNCEFILTFISVYGRNYSPSSYVSPFLLDRSTPSSRLLSPSHYSYLYVHEDCKLYSTPVTNTNACVFATITHKVDSDPWLYLLTFPT